MGGSAIETAPRTMVLVGRTGNGKSATGNSILGNKVFKSKASSSGVTTTTKLQKTLLTNGQLIQVIDTPGLFDSSVQSDFVGKEIVKCIDLAKDGIHAILFVLSVRTRFSHEEVAALRTLQNLFGNKILDYMILVFTGGDELEDNEETLEDYLGRECPQPLKDVVALCKNRCVLFDNKTKNELKRTNQVDQLLSLVHEVLTQNGGQPFTNELLTELKEGAKKLRDQQVVDSQKHYSKQEISELKEEMQRSYEQQLKRITEMVMSKLIETTRRLEQQLAEEQVARLTAEKNAQQAQRESNDEIRKLRGNLKETEEELRKRGDNKRCDIL